MFECYFIYTYFLKPFANFPPILKIWKVNQSIFIAKVFLLPIYISNRQFITHEQRVVSEIVILTLLNRCEFV